MSYELRTPMNAILGLGHILEMHRLGARKNESVQQIMKAGQHLLQLVNEILEISRIEAGELSISIEPVPVEETVLEALDLVCPLARQRKISLLVDENAPFMPMDNAYISADRQRLRQVI